MNLSLNTRLLAASLLTLAVFMGAAGWALDRAYRNSAITAIEYRLQTRIFGLLGAADLDAEDHLFLPDNLAEARYSQPGSGLFAMVFDMAGNEIWRSQSALDIQVPVFSPVAVNESMFKEATLGDNNKVFSYQFGIAWESESGETHTFIFTVLESQASFLNEVTEFRNTLWLWLGIASALLLFVQGTVLTWSLVPLRRVAQEIKSVESGQQDELINEYPREISSLSNNLNALLRNERRQQERYRNTLADLAHSLKTSLAVLTGWVESRNDAEEMKPHVNRMREIIDYQLGRSSAVRKTFTKPVALRPAVDKVIQALQKVYHEKVVTTNVAIGPDAQFYGDEGDLLEVLGNLLDNAFKFCKQEIKITNRIIPGQQRSGIEIVISDDGPGIDEDIRSSILERGVRADTQVEGQGIGLSVTQEIVLDYGGRIEFGGDGDFRNQVIVSFPSV